MHEPIRTFTFILKWPFGRLRIRVSTADLDRRCHKAEQHASRSIIETAIAAVATVLENQHVSDVRQHGGPTA